MFDYKFLKKNEKEKLLADALLYKKQISWETLRAKCDQYENIVIWGYSKIGCYVADTLKKNGYSNIIAFGDNDTNKIGASYKGIRVINASQVAMLDNTLIINSSQLAYNAINNQLILLGVNAENIFTYKHKGLTYYKAISGSEYEYELREIYYREFGDYQKFDEIGYRTAVEKITDEMTEIYGLNEWFLLQSREVK